MRPVGVTVGLFLILAFSPGFLWAQDPADSSQPLIRDIKVDPSSSAPEIKRQLHVKEGRPFVQSMLDTDLDRLRKSSLYQHVEGAVKAVDGQPGMVDIAIFVKEYQNIEAVELVGIKSITLEKEQLTLKAGDAVNPYRIKADQEFIRETYLKKGYHFVQVAPETAAGQRGVTLRWIVREGPLVSVGEIIFTGNPTVSPGKLKSMMVTEENGIFSTGPFVESVLKVDEERIKLYYRQEGWLDIVGGGGNRVFVQSVRFNEAKTRATIVIHIDEGQRYRLKSVSVKGNKLFTAEEIRSALKSKPGEFYTEQNLRIDLDRLRDRYGELAYLNAVITPEEVFTIAAAEVDLTLSVQENEKVYVGAVIIQGNNKTRDDVIRREIHVYPGEEYNGRELKRGIDRLAGNQWFLPVQQGGIRYEMQPGPDPAVQDLLVDVDETQTGNVRFAGGYSSSFGVVGLVELTQRNFDISDLPKSFEDFVEGTAFAGGGQFMRISMSPGARRSSYGADFREPYLFGEEVGLKLRGAKVNTLREAYDESTLDLGVGLDRRWGDFKAGLAFQYLNMDVGNVGTTAPFTIVDLEGSHSTYSLSPSLQYDSRDSPFFTSSGMNVSLTHEYAGGFLPGDFDFRKTSFKSAFYFPVYKNDYDRLHVISAEFMAGLAHAMRGSEEVPFYERFYAGGRNTVRGFRFRGIGPRENKIPVGGDVLAVANLEYSFPLYGDMIRGAMFYDTANLAPGLGDFKTDEFRMSTGVGVRIIIPYLGQLPIAIDFAVPIAKEVDDRRQAITFDFNWF